MFVVSGTVSGYSGDGSGITVTVHTAATGQQLASLVTATGGTFSLPWKEGKVALFARASQALLTGQSATAAAEWIETGPGRAAPGGRMGDD